jgi:hypothetical protein
VDYNDPAKILQSTNQAYYELISMLRERLESYKVALDSSSTGIQNLISEMGELLKARTSRTLLSIVVGAIAIIGGVVVLWYSSSIGAGFHQTLLIAIGGALITFCLVELILDRVIEIPSREAKKLEGQVDKLKSLNTQIADGAQVLLESMREMDERLDEVLPQLKKSAFPDES